MSEIDLLAGAGADVDIFDTLAAEAPVESAGMVDLPVDAMILMRTSTSKDGTGKTAARTDFFHPKNDPDKTLYQFRTGLIAIGGDDKCNSKEHKGKYLFFDAFVHPGEKENVSQTLSGRLTGFLNSVFAAGVKTKERKGKDKDAVKMAAMERWQKTISFLRGVATNTGLSPKQYDGDRARFVSGLAVAALEETPAVVLVKTGMVKQGKDGDKVVGIKSIEDVTPETLAEFGIEMFEGESLPSAAVTF